MAMYSEFYYSSEFTLFKWLRLPYNFCRHFLSPMLLSRRLVYLFDNAQLDFARSMMDLPEYKPYRIYQEISEHKISVNEEVKIPPEPLQVYSESLGRFIDIPIPSSHIGIKPVCCRLLSNRKRSGMVIKLTFSLSERLKVVSLNYLKMISGNDNDEPSRHLILHGKRGLII